MNNHEFPFVRDLATSDVPLRFWSLHASIQYDPIVAWNSNQYR